jgi:PAS domain S-box-containing protein
MLANLTHDVFPTCLGTADHLVRFYDDNDLLMTEVGDFIDAALRVGGSAIIIATPDHVSSLRRRFCEGSIGPQQVAALAAKLSFHDAEETLNQFMIDGWPDASRFDAVVGKIVRMACAEGGIVHAFGEMVALLCAQDRFDAAIRLEEMWNTLAGETQFSLFCAYPWKLFPTTESSSAFRAVCKAHSHICESYESALVSSALTTDTHGRTAELEQKARAMLAEVARRTDAEEALTQRERELADFVDNSAEGLHRVGKDGTILWANRAELEMLGYHPDEYIGRHIADFHADRPVIEDILTKLTSGETIYDYPARLKCSDGTIKHVVIHSNAYFENGELRYTRCFTRDATERHQRDEAYLAREKLLKELTEANQAKDEFLAMLAHELRNPLAPILSAAQLINTHPSTDLHIRRTAAIITRQALQLKRLVDDLLDASRIHSAKLTLQLAAVDVRAVIASALETVQPMVDLSGSTLRVDLPGQPVWIDADSTRIAQCVANLLHNAFKFTPSAGHIELQVVCGPDETVIITVTDSGRGMSAEMLPRLFSMFAQESASGSDGNTGLGIGLALSNYLVTQHGGTLTARSAGLGLGARFSITLPRAPAPLASIDSAPTPSTAASPSTAHARVLVVDDNVDAAEMLQALLGIHGITADVAHSGTAALEMIGASYWDAIVLDIGLPDMSGYDVAATSRARNLLADDTLLVALTGWSDAESLRKSAEAGFRHHLNKPVGVDVLLGLLEAHQKN